MAEIKTQKNDDSVEDFIAGIDDDRKREDARTLLGIMERVTGDKPHMWGPSIIGFGDQHYKYETGREGDLVQDRILTPEAEPDALCDRLHPGE